jgi:hypothetical protein
MTRVGIPIFSTSISGSARTPSSTKRPRLTPDAHEPHRAVHRDEREGIGPERPVALHDDVIALEQTGAGQLRVRHHVEDRGRGPRDGELRDLDLVAVEMAQGQGEGHDERGEGAQD